MLWPAMGDWITEKRTRNKKDQEYEVISDGVTVWINTATALIGRFGQRGIDVHGKQGEECLHCTHTFTTAADWPIFVAKMLEHHGVAVADEHKPKRFSGGGR